jgi:hypothetical protein
MVSAALVATQLTDHTPRVKMLTLAGVDVNGRVGFGGNGYHVPIESIEVDEQGPGGVSTMQFDLVDPLANGPLPADGDEVQYWDLINDVPLFAGFVANWSTRPLPSGQGRVTTISCVGFEIILDWALIPAAMTLRANLLLSQAVLSLAAAAAGTGPLRAFSGGPSSQEHPVGWFTTSDGLGLAVLMYDVPIAAGTSLREALGTAAAAAAGSAGLGNPFVAPAALFTVDFYRGLRAMSADLVGAWASDFASLTVVDTVAGANAADGLEHETDATQIVRGVFVKGANAAGTGLISDGSGKLGRIAFIDDSTIDTAAKLADAQATYLSQYVIATRGSFDLVDWTRTPGVRVGSLVYLTDAVTGATGAYRIYGLTKRFLKSGRETWTVQYGGLRPSANRLLRRLTRAVRS